MRKLVSTLVFAFLTACGGGSGGDGGALAPVEPFARLIQGANSGTMVTLKDGSAVLLSRSGGGSMAFEDPESGASQPLGAEPVLTCIAPDGRLLWQRPAPDVGEQKMALHAAADGTFWMFGMAGSSLDLDGFTLDIEGFPYMVFAARLNASGTIIGVRNFAVGNDLSRPVLALGADGSSAVAMTISGTAIFDPAGADRMQTSNTADDLSVLRYDAAGRYMWRRRVASDGSQDVRATALCLRPDGGLVFHCHYLWGSTTILWTDDVDTSPRFQTDSTLVLLDAVGDVVNVYEAPDADWTVFSIAPHLDGHVLCGQFLGTLNDGDGAGQDVSAGDANPGFVMRCGADGRPEWTVLQVPDDGASGARFDQVDADAAGRIVLAGFVQGSAVFQSKDAGYGISSFGRSNGVVMLLDRDGGWLWIDSIRSTEWSYAGPAGFLPGGDVAIRGETIDGFFIKGSPIDVELTGDAIFYLRLTLD